MLSRGFWLLMGAVHAYALWASWRSFLSSAPDGAGLDGCLTLTLSMVFFALKVGGASFLEFRGGRRAWVAICLLVAVVHIDCVDPSLTGALSDDATDLLATTMLIGGLTRAPETTRNALDRVVSLYPPWGLTDRSGEVVWLDTYRPRCLVLASHLFLLRAPPA